MRFRSPGEEFVASDKVESQLYSLDRVLSGFPIVQANNQTAVKCSQGYRSLDGVFLICRRI
jgi:hypothetical protein